MMNIKTKLVLAFVMIVLLCSAAALAVSFGGYNLVVAGIAASADSNNAHVANVRDLKDLIAAQQQLISASMLNLDMSGADSFNKNSERFGQIAEKLSGQSENTEISELNKLIETNRQYNGIFTDRIASGVKNADRTGYINLLADFKAQYDSLLAKEQELKNLVQTQVDATMKDILSDGGMLTELSAQQQLALERLTAAVDTAWKEIHAAAAANDELQSELEGLASQQPGTPQSGAGDKAEAAGAGYRIPDPSLEESVREALAAVLENDAHINSLLNGLDTNTMAAALAKLAAADRALLLTQQAYADAMTALSESTGNASGFRQNIQDAGETLMLLEKLLTAGNAPLAADAAQSVTVFSGMLDQLFNAKSNIENNGLAESWTDAEKLYETQLQSLIKLESAYRGYLAEDVEKSKRLKNTLLLTLAGIALLSLLIGMFAALLLSRNILNPIRNMTDLLEKAGKGDLTERVKNERKDEIGTLGARVNDVLDGQQKMLEQVKTTTGEIGALRKGLADLFAHSRESAGKVSSGLRNIMEGLFTGVKHPAESLNKSGTIRSDDDRLALSTGKAVEDGMKAIEIAASGEKSVEEAEAVIRNVTETVRQIANSISDLEDSSSKIGAITNTITEIASRTNLLALNAAIEAARAGQQGKGFTVLADEIRKLSEGSNKAAGEIKHLISEIQGRIQYAVDRIGDGVRNVDEGVGRIDSARNSILEITGTVQQIVETLREASNAVKARQDNTMELIGTIDTLTQAASRTAASGEAIDAGLELQKKTMEQMEEMTLKLDAVTGTLESLLERFKV